MTLRDWTKPKLAKNSFRLRKRAGRARIAPVWSRHSAPHSKGVDDRTPWVLANAAAQFLPAGLLIIALLVRTGFRDLWAPAATFLLFLLSAVALNIRTLAPGTTLGSLHWNWEGKIAALLVIVGAIAVAPAELQRRLGFARGIPMRRLPVVLALCAAILGFAAAKASLGGVEPWSLETLAFQATMPGLQEELAFRGLWWALLCLALDPERGEDDGVPWRTLLTTTILFASAHGIEAGPDGLDVNPIAAGATMASGLLYGALQGVGRAIWLTILMHNAANVLLYAAQMSP